MEPISSKYQPWVLSHFYSSSSTSPKIAFLFEPHITSLPRPDHSIIRDYNTLRVDGQDPANTTWDVLTSRNQGINYLPTSYIIWSTAFLAASFLLWHLRLRFLWPCIKAPRWCMQHPIHKVIRFISSSNPLNHDQQYNLPFELGGFQVLEG